jgi:hypothetical protein
MKKVNKQQRDAATTPKNRTGAGTAGVSNTGGASSFHLGLTAEEAERAQRWAIISQLNPGGLTGDADKINKQKLAFEGQ